jgi:hypothetical protein
MRLLLIFWLATQLVDATAATLELVDDSVVIAAPRFAVGDVDGDGRSELVVGGRAGPFVAETEALAGRTARIEVRAQGVGEFGLQAWSELPEVIEDVAIGDIDGDGQMEVLAIGWHRLWVWSWAGQELKLERVYSFGAQRLWRIDAADIDGDGQSEVVLAARSVEAEREVAAAHIGVYRLADECEQLSDLEVDGHIGDLCLLAGPDGIALVVEMGAEEVGGLLSSYDFFGWQPAWRYSQQATQERVRSLSMAVRTRSGVALLAVGDVGGRVGLWQLGRSGLAQVGQLDAGAGMLRAVDFAAGNRGEVQIWLGTGMGTRGRLWRAGGF